MKPLDGKRVNQFKYCFVLDHNLPLVTTYLTTDYYIAVKMRVNLSPRNGISILYVDIISDRYRTQSDNLNIIGHYRTYFGLIYFSSSVLERN